MADRDAKKVERQLDRISAGLPSGVGGFLRWLRSPLSRWVRIPAGLLLIIGGVVGFVGVGILDGAAWRLVWASANLVEIFTATLVIESAHFCTRYRLCLGHLMSTHFMAVTNRSS